MLLEDLRQLFDAYWPRVSPTHYVAAPGRINLIGEHIDYNGLPVFPMALDRKVEMLFRPAADKTIRVFNADERYSPIEFTLSEFIEPYPDGEWGNYPKAAAQRLVQEGADLVGMDAVLQSDIPPASGLSSSSALVVATILALVHANGMQIGRLELMDIAATAERYVGTEGGGMDQAICIGAEEGTAAKIEFDPLRLSYTSVPPNWRFVVADSRVGAEKSGAVRNIYNRRTEECAEAASVVADVLGLRGEAHSYSRLLARLPVDRLVAVADRDLIEPLRSRFMHVVSEAVRVLRAERAMLENDSDTFGTLMTQSHISLRDDFEVSVPALDRLVEAALSSGAKGARLTGAGFGGCVIALCTEETVDGVLGGLEAGSHSRWGTPGRIEDALFVARPGCGAFVVDL